MLSDEEEDIKYRLSVFDARHMNDPNEGHVLEQYLNSGITQNIEMNEICQTRQTFRNTFTFLKSFTTKIDCLPMWVQYANDGQGCQVIIDPDMFVKADQVVKKKENDFLNGLLIEDDYSLYHVAYFDGKDFKISNGKIVTREIEALRNSYEKLIEQLYEEKDEDGFYTEFMYVIDNILSRVKYLIKKEDYSSEAEVRVMFFRAGTEIDLEQTAVDSNGFPKIFIHFKVPTQIREIILGPKVKKGYDVVPYIYKQLGKMSKNTIRVTRSGIEYI